MHPESLLLLIELIATNANIAIRQQAAIQANRLAEKHWESIPKEQKPAVREHLVQAVLREPSAACRHSESRLVASIATVDFEDGQWQDLFPALVNLSTGSDVTQP